MRVVVVAPHPDDEAIGCGGAIARHAADGAEVHVAFLTSGELGSNGAPSEEARATREAEARRAAEVLGVAEVSFLRRRDWGLADELEPATAALAALATGAERLYAPHRAEWHPDHRAGAAIAREAAVRAGVPGDGVFGYEVWTPLAGVDHVDDVSAVMERKLEAIRCYASQLTAFDYVQAADGLASYRGALAGHCRYAEAFELSAVRHAEGDWE